MNGTGFRETMNMLHSVDEVRSSILTERWIFVAHPPGLGTFGNWQDPTSVRAPLRVRRFDAPSDAIMRSLSEQDSIIVFASHAPSDVMWFGRSAKGTDLLNALRRLYYGIPLEGVHQPRYGARP